MMFENLRAKFQVCKWTIVSYHYSVAMKGPSDQENANERKHLIEGLLTFSEV